jgi:hypothetical protein
MREEAREVAFRLNCDIAEIFNKRQADRVKGSSSATLSATTEPLFSNRIWPLNRSVD